MDVDFFRALGNLGDFSGPVCVLRHNKELLICTDLEESTENISEIGHRTFATGWMNANGTTGKWHTWKSVESFSDCGQYPTREKDLDLLQDTEPQSFALWNSSLNKTEFISTVRSMQDDMARGEYFLANLTRMVERNGRFDGIYIALVSCLIHDSPFRFFHRDGERTVIGLSPERFLRIENNIITTEPMKGTAHEKSELSNNVKEHNENTMMIDLVRSDLSRVCDPTTIDVLHREVLSSHPGLVQMSSVLQGTLSVDLTKAITSMMPIASVTGTPKPYVSKKIATYEPHERDIYCGAYGWVDTHTHQCDLAVGIRTIVIDDTQAHIGTGAGITIESDPDSEWEETELKVSRLRALVDQSTPLVPDEVMTSLAINETGQAFLLHHHCDRLSRHAHLVGHEIASTTIQQSAENFLTTHKVTSSRLRITITTRGTIECSCEEFGRTNDAITMGIAPAPYLGGDVPKYLDRTMYTRALSHARALSSSDIDDAFLIVHGHLTETTRANFFLRKNNEYFTPISEGIVRGIARAHTIDYLAQQGISVVEKNLTLADLIAADEIVTTNSVRGPLSVKKVSSVLLDEEIAYTSDSDTLFSLANEAFDKGFS